MKNKLQSLKNSHGYKQLKKNQNCLNVMKRKMVILKFDENFNCLGLIVFKLQQNIKI